MTTESAPVHNVIFGNRIDTLLVGGLSALVIGMFLIFSSFIPRELILAKFMLLTVLINGTHFMASYRLLYSSRVYALRYPWASVYMPLLLTAYAVGCFVALQQTPVFRAPLQILLIVNALYLALHYTGQAWGMMSSYAFLSDIKFTPQERFCFKLFLKILTGWQMLWSLTLLTDPPPWLPQILAPAFSTMTVLAAGTLFGGGVLFYRIRRRMHGVLPVRVALPYFLLHLWYSFLAVFPQSLFWVQISHALQYLALPLRVEINRAARPGTMHSAVRGHMLRYAAHLSLASAVVFVGIEFMLNFPSGGREAYWLVIVSCINIHHFFIDGCIWKIRNPVVRDELFAHLKR